MKGKWPMEAGWWKGVWSRYKYALLVIAAGALLLLLPEGQTGQETAPAAQDTPAAFDVEEMEEKLERALSQIEGAGEVTVVLTLKESARQVVAQDIQTSDTEQSRTTVILSQGSGGEQTVTLQQISPQYQGALVVCSGGDQPAVALEITNAVRALTGLSSDRISICKRQ